MMPKNNGKLLDSPISTSFSTTALSNQKKINKITKRKREYQLSECESFLVDTNCSNEKVFARIYN